MREKLQLMRTTLRKEIIEFLTPLTCMQSENSRRAVLYAAGLDVILDQIDLSGSPHKITTLLVKTLESYGKVNDTPALVVLLDEVKRQVGQDKQEVIQRFCEQLTIKHRKVAVHQNSTRRALEKAAAEKFRKVFRLDKNRRPLEYIQNKYEDKDEIVVDHTTKLIWQRAGSEGTMGHEKALSYVKKLNNDQFADYSDWRLPTIPELMSLLEPIPKNGNLYIAPVFDKRQQYCWGTDTRWSKLVRSVGFDNGSVHWSEYLNRISYVRAVRSLNIPEHKQPSPELTPLISQRREKTEQQKTEPTPKFAYIVLRSEPKSIFVINVQQELDLTHWRPQTYIQNEYEDRGEVVLDRATGLMWQKSGSEKVLRWQKLDPWMRDGNVYQYIQKLNTELFYCKRVNS